MWQLYSFLSLFSGATEETIDKATMIGSKAISHLNAAWIRNAISFGVSFFAAIIISRAFPSLVISVPIIILGILYGLNAITYTVLLKQVEITASSIITSFIPLVFLPIDLLILNHHFLPRQIIGVIILVLGGAIFFYRGRNHESAITRKQILLLISIFLFDALLVGFESYLFKDYFENLHLSETNFLVNMWGVMFLFLTVLVIAFSLYKRKIPAIHLHKKYMQGSFFSKIADYGGSFFFLKALTISSTSQVTSMDVFYPLVLLLVVIGTQKNLKVNLEEYLDRRSLIPKICGVITICLGAFLVR
jgi:drug/metabolite transporter (DMT)-like permease